MVEAQKQKLLPTFGYLTLNQFILKSNTEPKWRKWQTQRTQNPPPSDGLVGSTPTFGIHLKTGNIAITGR